MLHRRIIDRFRAKALVIGVVVALLGGGAALALPDEAVEGMNEATVNQTAAQEEVLEDEASEYDNEGGPPEEVREFLADLRTWISCIQEGARAHAAQQSNPDTRTEDAGYDVEEKLARCGEKPVNRNDSKEGEGTEAKTDVEADEAEEVEDRGRPEHARPPEWAGGPPEWAGPPEGAGGPPPGAGPGR